MSSGALSSATQISGKEGEAGKGIDAGSVIRGGSIRFGGGGGTTASNDLAEDWGLLVTILVRFGRPIETESGGAVFDRGATMRVGMTGTGGLGGSAFPVNLRINDEKDFPERAGGRCGVVGTMKGFEGRGGGLLSGIWIGLTISNIPTD